LTSEIKFEIPATLHTRTTVTRTQMLNKQNAKKKQEKISKRVAKLGQQLCLRRRCRRRRRQHHSQRRRCRCRLTFNIKRSIIASARPLKIAELS